MYVQLRETTRLRKEAFGVLLYEVASPRVEVVAPAEAVILAVLDGQATTEAMGEWVESTFALRTGEGRSVIDSLVRKYDRFLSIDSRALPPASHVYPPSAFAYDAPLWDGSGADLLRFRLSAPITLTWVVTKRCNFQCAYCFVLARRANAADDARLPLARFAEILSEAERLGVAQLMVTGGEPLLRRDVPEVIRIALRHRLSVDLNTNGYLLADASLTDRLAETGLGRVVISLDAARAETQAALSGVSLRAHARVLRGISACLARGIAVKTNTIICPMTVPELPELIELVRSLGGREMAFSHYTGSFQNRREPLFPSVDEYEWVAAELRKARIRHPDMTFECAEIDGIISDLRRRSPPGPSRCDSLKRGIIILPDGLTTFCDTLADDVRYVTGDLRLQSLAEVWASSKYKPFLEPDRRQFAGTSCAECERFDICMAGGHCYSRALFRFGTGWAPDPFCPVAFDADYRLF